MSVRELFAQKFGEDQAAAIEAAANEHNNGINSERGKGSDPFKWSLLISISYECWSRERFREYHKITAPVDEIRQWIKDHGELATHDGDCDYLALFAGAYNEYMPAKEEVQ